MGHPSRGWYTPLLRCLPAEFFQFFQLVEFVKAPDPAVLVPRRRFLRAETLMGQEYLRSMLKVAKRYCYQSLLTRVAAGTPSEREQLVRNNLPINSGCYV